MSTKTQITCPCGQPIQKKDVIQQGRFLRLFSPSFMYIKFRCSHCKRLGERFIPQDQWADEPGEQAPRDLTPAEAERLADLGSISVDEVVDFHFQLKDCSLADLLREMP